MELILKFEKDILNIKTEKLTLTLFHRPPKKNTYEETRKDGNPTLILQINYHVN